MHIYYVNKTFILDAINRLTALIYIYIYNHGLRLVYNAMHRECTTRVCMYAHEKKLVQIFSPSAKFTVNECE